MYHLRLCKAKSYRGIVTATEKRPDVYVPEKDQADSLVATGYFVLLDDGNGEAAGKDETGGSAGKETVEETGEASLFEDEDEGQGDTVLVELQAMTKDELMAYAKDRGINLAGCSKKDEIFQRIIQELARANAARNALRAE